MLIIPTRWPADTETINFPFGIDIAQTKYSTAFAKENILLINNSLKFVARGPITTCQQSFHYPRSINMSPWFTGSLLYMSVCDHPVVSLPIYNWLNSAEQQNPFMILMKLYCQLIGPGWSGCDFTNVSFNLVLPIIFRSSPDIALIWVPQDLTDKSTLVQVMA